MSVAEQIYEHVKALPEKDQAEILLLVRSRVGKSGVRKRISTMGLIKTGGKSATLEDFREARREAWKGLGEVSRE